MVAGILFDIDGVLTVSWEALPGAAEAVCLARASGRPFGLVTNTSSRSRQAMVEQLLHAGIDVELESVFTGVSAAATYLRNRLPGASCLFLNSGDVGDDLKGIDLVDPGSGVHADVVLLGGAGPEVGWLQLNHAYRLVDAGAPLVALHRSTHWQTSEGPNLDMGAYLAGLELATGRTAIVVGKPSRAFFEAVLDALGADRDGTIMIGDDIDSDVLGAQAAGLIGVLVRTGKFTETSLRLAKGSPDHVVDSVRDALALVGLS
ncbi:MAG: HAD-IIA family hydrolase [Acidimicrobiales bacterium]